MRFFCYTPCRCNKRTVPLLYFRSIRLEDVINITISNLVAAVAVRAEGLVVVAVGTGTDDVLMLQLHHPHRGFHILSFHHNIYNLTIYYLQFIGQLDYLTI